ncbi:MAG: segregation/condensation protein A [Patescibacteria group bacterium]|nr:segregation/condensation protein A [Patescibacteria group bacterium]MDE2438654.1 segregation/condensation protein A [Patescibacteria group bacterium]
MFQVQNEQFSGPFDVLLTMIEDKKLQITEFSLSRITSDFLAYVRGLQEKDYAEIGDFLVVAARLIFLKSRELLPKIFSEEEEGEGNLELQLTLYREIKQMSKVLGERFGHYVMLGRGYLYGYAPAFLPGKNCTQEALTKHIGRIMVAHNAVLYTRVERRLVTIEEKVAHILERLEAGGGFHFHELSKEQDRIDVIVLFLALLELMKSGIVHPMQENNFGDITIAKHVA